MDNVASVRLRREWLSLDRERIYSTLRDVKLPQVAVKEHIKAVVIHKHYLVLRSKEQSLPDISRPCFLYLLICSRSNRSANLHMRDYGYFSDESVDLSKISYRDFTQSFVEQDISPMVSSKVHPHYEGKFISTVYFEYPTSLRSILDKIRLVTKGDYVLLSEGDVVYIKFAPVTMDSSPPTYKPPDKDCLYAEVAGSTLKADNSHILVTSPSRDLLRSLVSTVEHWVSVTKVDNISSEHMFSFPRREIHYSQILEWLRRKGIRYNSSDTSQHIIAEGFADQSRYEFMNVTLDINKCYREGGTEVYRIKGDTMFQILVHSSKSRGHIERTLRSIYGELDNTISDVYPDPLELDATNIAKLRATNSLVFDSLYCRKAPPIVQPLIIQESQIEESLAMGKMILRYQGILYTTRHSSVSKGQDYIGMINRFGDYDPSRPYIPIIRTYKTNHLISRNFKEFKAYLLRHSTHPNSGYISQEDLILPQGLAYLYRRRVVNPDPVVESIHSKKTIIANTNKVSTGEVPDSIKTLLGTSGVRRHIENHNGTGLLDICDITGEELLIYAIYNRERYKDLISLSVEDIERDVLSHNVDHRVYGKLIEDMTSTCLIVFSMDGLVPYRYSRCEAHDCLLLFMSPSGRYDRVAVNIHDRIKYNVKHLKDLVNSVDTPDSISLVKPPTRPVDYTHVYLRLLGYLYHSCKSLEIDVSYKIIDEAEVPDIVEEIYNGMVHYEGYVRIPEQRYPEGSVFSRGQQCRVLVSKDLLLKAYSPMVSADRGKEIVVFSPIDMSRYNAWNFLYEDCLYFGIGCYCLGEKEEIRVVPRSDL